MFRALRNGNSANVFTALSARNGHDLVLQQTQGEELALTIRPRGCLQQGV